MKFLKIFSGVFALVVILSVTVASAVTGQVSQVWVSSTTTNASGDNIDGEDNMILYAGNPYNSNERACTLSKAKKSIPFFPNITMETVENCGPNPNGLPGNVNFGVVTDTLDGDGEYYVDATFTQYSRFANYFGVGYGRLEN